MGRNAQNKMYSYLVCNFVGKIQLQPDALVAKCDEILKSDSSSEFAALPAVRW